LYSPVSRGVSQSQNFARDVPAHTETARVGAL